MSATIAAVVFAAEQCEIACIRGDARAAAFWATLAFDAVTCNG